jgi:hypothetical protein
MNKYCGTDMIYTIPKKINLNKINDKYGIPYIFCSWKIIIDDPTQILNLEFFDYVKKNIKKYYNL